MYFDIEKYNKDHRYGVLSGRNLDDIINASRKLDGVGEKRNQADFALWKKASPEHIMRWPSPWSDGFPGWHCECTAMGRKYLGKHFDIHGGGMDLVFPHHECEIAQAVASQGSDMVRYWMHNNMITINGQKMGKSLGNFITLAQFFSGDHPSLDQAYTPMTIRFFILQAHYRGTVDFSNEALKAAEKAYERMMDGWHRLCDLKAADATSAKLENYRERCAEAMNDDLNTPNVIATLFDACRVINQVNDGNATMTQADIDELKSVFQTYLFDVLGVRDDSAGDAGSVNLEPYRKAVDLLLDIRKTAKANKDWTTSDLIRNKMNEAGFDVKDTKEGFEWKVK